MGRSEVVYLQSDLIHKDNEHIPSFFTLLKTKGLGFFFFLSLKTGAYLDPVVPDEAFKILILINSWALYAFLKQM